MKNASKKKILYVFIAILALIATLLILFFAIERLQIKYLSYKGEHDDVQKNAVLSDREKEKLPEYIYGKVVSVAGDALIIRKIDRYEGIDEEGNFYTIKISSSAVFTRQELAENKSGDQVFVPKEGSIDDIKKDWYVKAEYPSTTGVVSEENSNDPMEIFSTKILYSEQPPFMIFESKR